MGKYKWNKMKSFNEFIGEGVRERMTPKSEEDQRRGFDKIGPQTVLNYGNSELIPWVVDYALERGANPNLRLRINNVEMTPLEHAALEGNMEVVRVLLKHDSVVITKNAIGNAIHRGHTAIVDLLEQRVGPGLNESVRDRMTPKSEQDILEQSKKWKPWEILEYGASNGLISLVKYAIDMGADVRQFDSYALRLAVSNDYKEIVKLLLKSGADIHTLDDCLIIIACEGGLVDMAKLLIKHGANIHARNNRPMKMAIKKGHDKIIRLLQKYDNTERKYRKIDSHLRTNIGVGLMEESVRDKMTPRPTEQIEGTLSNMSQMEKNMELINAIRRDDTFLANMLIDKGANPNTRYANNWSALMCAIQRGQTDVVRKLIDNGADIDHLGNGITPFTLAEAWDRKEIMEILKKQGARQ